MSMDIEEWELREILDSLPPASFAFAYGSGVIRQYDGKTSTFPEISRGPDGVISSIENGDPSLMASKKRKVVDFILAVDDAKCWHEMNIKLGNGHHYSSMMRWLGPSAIANVQEAAFGARIYYNTLVPFVPDMYKSKRITLNHLAENRKTATIAAHEEAPGDSTSGSSLVAPLSSSSLTVLGAPREFKYGVISIRHLVHDLNHWSSLYVAGRLHKPVHILCSNREIEQANERNIENAARTALLTLPEEFGEEQMYETLASLSYMGDIRMSLGAEDSLKTKKIVRGNFEGFRRLYAPVLSKFGHIVSRRSPSSNTFQQGMDAASREALYSALPISFLSRVHSIAQSLRDRKNAVLLKQGPDGAVFAHEKKQSTNGTVWEPVSKPEISRRMACLEKETGRQALVSALATIVRNSSWKQSMKGLLTAGMSRSAQYAAAKLAKGRFSWLGRIAW